MKTVFKYPLVVAERQTLFLPKGAKALHVEYQRGNLCLWCLIDPAAQGKDRAFFVRGSGHKCGVDIDNSDHIGTVFDVEQYQTFVWHIFMEKEK